ncbi:hypothetical protein [Rugosimonospora acidiphila]
MASMSGPRPRAIAILMTLEAASLAAASSIHLTHGSTGAGIPEAIICVVLAVGALVVHRRGARWRATALATVGFAIFGFLVGLNSTLRGHQFGDIAYHVTVLPVLIVTFVLALRSGSPAPGAPAPGRPETPAGAPQQP